MKKSLLVIAIATAVAGPALAQDGAAPAVPATAPTAQGDASSDTSYLDKTVCRIYPPPTGTRLGTRRICKTEREWRDLQRESQQDITKRQKFDYGLPGG